MHDLALGLLTGAAVLVAYAYVGYPVLLRGFAALRPRRPTPLPPTEWPPVTVTIPVYNEERTIRAKLEDVLRYDYPRDRIQILVVSDCSTDGTDAIVQEYAARGVELLRLSQRAGKTAAENAAVARVRGDIVVNSDASVRVPPDALKRLIAAFQDPHVGVASGRDVSISRLAAESNQGESSYVGYEMWIRALETRAAGIVGASGCFYGVRLPLQRLMVPETLSRDFAAPLLARSEGYRAVSVDAAVAFVPRAGAFRSEYRRKVRTMTRGIQTLVYLRRLLNPFRYGLFAWELFSHKVCRWLVPWAGVAATIGLVLLAPSVSWARWLLVAAGVIVLGAVAGWCWPEGRAMPRFVSIPALFVAGNLAALQSSIAAFRGENNAVWEPTRRDSVRIG